MRPEFVPLIALAGLASCHSEVQQAQNTNLQNATRIEPVTPATRAANTANAANAAAAQNTAIPQAPAKTAAQQTPSDFVGAYAALLQAHKFDEAYRLLGPGMNVSRKDFEAKLAPYKTIRAAIRQMGPVEGAAGSLYATVQLTLTGEKKDGTPYTMTGPVTLRRVNDVPGSTLEQRQWHIYKMDLTANPKAAEQAIKR